MMAHRRLLLSLLVLAWLLGPAPARAGEVIAFTAGEQGEALPETRWKGVIAEFLDPQASGLGKSLGYLLWREALTAISDQAGAGVILARAPGERPITDMLEADYHLAAVRIARAQNAQMAFWGAVETRGEQVFVDSYLTMLPEVRGGELTLTLAGKERGARGFSARLERTWFDFDMVETTRERLFERWVVTRREGAPVRAEASDDAAVVTRLADETAVHAVGMSGRWFRVEGPGGGGYVKLDDVEVPPREVRADLERVNLRRGPGTDFPVIDKLDLSGRFTVLDRRYRAGEGLWYKLPTPAGEGWIAAWLVSPIFSLPAVDFLEGLYRYQAGRYDAAARAFRRFLHITGPSGRNVNRAAAQLLLGASEMLRQPDVFGAQLGAALRAFDEAHRLTPYDATVYTLRALAHLGAEFGRISPAAAKNIDRALELNPESASARALAASLYGALDPSRVEHRILPLDADPATRRAVEGLVERYGIRP